MDREKAIKGLEELYGFLFREYANIPAEESKIYYERTCAIRDALALLKQEAVEPKVEKAILDYQSWHYICGDCGGQIDINDNYCRHCGRVVAHLSNKI